jgi:BirA family biotin operon repressor/biotin-[acetyl-CoA-carboxylase] ligase
MKTAQKLLALLYDARRVGRLVSLGELPGLLGVTGRRIDLAIAQLARVGQPLERGPRGISLSGAPLLDSYLIERDLGTGRIGRNVICFDQVDSTNDVAFASAPQAGADGLAVFAESQLKGRGRLGRQWISPPRANILMSVLLAGEGVAGVGPAMFPKSEQRAVETPATPAWAHEPLTIAAGLAVAGAIEQTLGVGCGLKWPNDVLIDGAKVAGILVEVRTRGRKTPDVVIGIGINVHASPPGSRVEAPATDLAAHTDVAIDRIELARAVLKRLDYWIDLVARDKLLSLHRQWMAKCEMINQRLTVASAGKTYTGRMLDIDPLRGLVLCDDHGRTIHLAAKRSTVVR